MELGQHLSEINRNLVDLILEETDDQQREKLKDLFNRSSTITAQLVHKNVNEATEQYRSVTSALGEANQALEDSINRIKQVAETIEKVAEVVDKVAVFAASAT